MLECAFHMKYVLKVRRFSPMSNRRGGVRNCRSFCAPVDRCRPARVPPGQVFGLRFSESHHRRRPCTCRQCELLRMRSIKLQSSTGTYQRYHLLLCKVYRLVNCGIILSMSTLTFSLH